MSHPSDFSPPPQQSGGGSSVLVIVLIVLGVLFVVCGGLCAGCVYFVGKSATVVQKGIAQGLQFVQLAPAYNEAHEAVAANQQVIDRLGEPIELADGATPFRHDGQGELKKSGETIQFDLKGSKGTGIVSVVATGDEDHLFHAAKITVTFTDGSVVDVPIKAEKPMAETKEP